MNYSFDASVSQELDSLLNKEYLITDGAGGYCASTVCGCNTRKYHGLLVAPNVASGNRVNHVIVSSVEEEILYKDRAYNLGVHQYVDSYHPKGYQHIKKFNLTPVPSWIYQIDDAIISKELIISPDQGVLVRYKVLEAEDNLTLNLSPFLAYRSVHQLCRANMLVNKKITRVENGVMIKLYSQYKDLYMQLSQPADFIHAPDWYYNIEYSQERLRGYDSVEDNFVPGYFKMTLKKGDQFVFSAGFEQANMKSAKTRFTNLLKKKTEADSFAGVLEKAAEQFIIKTEKETEIKAGYYWFERWARDTFISLPGISLATNNPKLFKSVVNSMLPLMKDGVFPNSGYGDGAHYNTVDASLWFIWALQQYALSNGSVWKEYGDAIKAVLYSYKNGTINNIRMDEDGLITAGAENVALTWMDVVIDGVPVTPRTGKAVEINALWFNAVCFALQQASAFNDTEFLKEFAPLTDTIKASFVRTFWSDEREYLADFSAGEFTNWSIRPNQIFAISLPHSPLPDTCKKSIIDTVKNHLLTPVGLRTLSQDDPEYRGVYNGDQYTRDRAYHQGTVWPWLIGHFAEAWLKVYGKDGLPFIESVFEGFALVLDGPGLNSVSEVFDGDFPHHPGGAVSQAWNIAELLRINKIKNDFTNTFV